MTDALPVDKLTGVYRKIRAKIDELNKEHDAKIAALEEDLKKVANTLKDHMQAIGVTSLKNEHGTVMLTKKSRYFAQDWSSFREFVIENGAFDLLEKRIAQKNMAEFLADNPEVAIKGLAMETEVNVSVRKPSNT
ncbi:MAG TPA: hypothetical protein PLQ34_07695 [Ferrovaceae bacterium]|jgi:phage tail tape-measure protein|nr:hypothetical protein [Ferrovaceae bacterium]